MKNVQYATVSQFRDKIIVSNTELIILNSLVIHLEPNVQKRPATEVAL